MYLCRFGVKDDNLKHIDISYALLESAARPDIHSKSYRSQEAEPSLIWMVEGGLQDGPHFPTGFNEFITCSCMLRKKYKFLL